MAGNIYKGRNIAEAQEFGGFGFECVNDVSTHTAPDGSCYVALQFVADSEIAAITAAETLDTAYVNLAGIEGPLLVAGLVLYGKFASVTLASGTCVAYFGPLE